MNIEKLIGLFEQTHSALQQRAARSVDTYLVVRNWLFGWYIVEFENGGAERAELDKLPETMQNVIGQLASRFVLGWTHYVTLLTVRNDYERRFYEIEAALSSKQRRTEKTD